MRARYQSGKFGPIQTQLSDNRPASQERVRLNLVEPRAVEEFVKSTEPLLENCWDYFGLDGVQEYPFDWHLDPSTGVQSPRVFALDLNYRDPQVVGNLKYVWEKNRHSHFSRLAAAYALSGDERFAANLAERFTSWVEQNPFLEGINWTHPLEHGLRLLVWVWCERWLRGSEHYDKVFGADSPLWESIERHQEYIESTYSVGSSANNHLIGEMAGLFLASSAWPVVPASTKRQQLAGRILERELERQTFPDGLNREQAFYYHVNVAEYYLLCMDEASRSGYSFSTKSIGIVRKMVEAIYALTDVGGNGPRYGDSDDATVLEIVPPGVSRFEWLYLMARRLVDAEVPVGEGAGLANALFGYPEFKATVTTNPDVRRRCFPDAGKYQLAFKRDTADEIRLLAHAGPLGFGSLAAHGHADALSFELSVGGDVMLVDTGTFTYHFDNSERNRFRGTAYHNTLLVDKLDQSRPAGPFLWASKAGCKVLRWEPTEEGGILSAEHDGYSAEGMSHRRTFKMEDETIQIVDEVGGDGVHEVELFFHFHPDAIVESINGGAKGVRGDRVLKITSHPQASIDILRGQGEWGWYSPVFGKKVPTSVLRYSLKVQLPKKIETKLKVETVD